MSTDQNTYDSEHETDATFEKDERLSTVEFVQHNEENLDNLLTGELRISTANDDKIQQKADKHEIWNAFLQQMNSAIDIIDSYLLKINQNRTKTFVNSDELDESLSLINKTIDNTTLVPCLIQLDLPEKSVQWLINSDRYDKNIFFQLLLTLHNIARHDDGANQLVKHSALQIIKQIQDKDQNSMNSSIKILLSLIYGLLSTENEWKIEKQRMTNLLDHILSLIIICSKTNHLFTADDGITFHISEFLIVLVKLFVTIEPTLDYLLSNSNKVFLIELFRNLLMNYENVATRKSFVQQFTLSCLLNIIWNISLEPRFHEQLENDEQFLNFLKHLTTQNLKNPISQYRPRSMENVLNSAQSILYNLGEDSKQFFIDQTSQTKVLVDRTNNNLMQNSSQISLNKTKQKASVMICYSRKNDDFCDKILEILSEKSNLFNVWIDREHSQTSDLWETINQGIQSSNLIICLVSKHFLQSKFCRQQFVYSLDQLSKPILLIYVGYFQSQSWIEIRPPQIKSIRFSNLKQLEENKIFELNEILLESLHHHVNTLNNNNNNKIIPLIHFRQLKRTDQSENISTYKNQVESRSIKLSASYRNQTNENNLTNKTVKSIDDWTSNDIQIWFNENQISNEIYDLYQFATGKELLVYGHDLLRNPEKHQQMYSNIYKKKNHGEEIPPHQFIRFVKAVEQLVDKYPVTISPTSPTLRTTTPQPSAACLLS